MDGLMPRLADLPLISLPSSLPDNEAEVVVDDEVAVVAREVPDHLQEPVVAVVGAPGHGKSSVANLILWRGEVPSEGSECACRRPHSGYFSSPS